MADTFSTRCVHLHILSHGCLDCYDTVGIEIIKAQISSTHHEETSFEGTISRVLSTLARWQDSSNQEVVYDAF